jgi:ectoine hydroxylase-related dioxygenase (phytanoyl-CoA dioxygenase family)
LVGQTGDVNGVPVEVHELTGKPGDVVIAHLHVYHAASPNVGTIPRQMLGKTV